MYTNATKFYIDGAWVTPSSSDRLDVINPATEEVVTQIALGSEKDA
jgi:aldehyde dehydrogenase (NAD+)